MFRCLDCFLAPRRTTFHSKAILGLVIAEAANSNDIIRLKICDLVSALVNLVLSFTYCGI